eukprot:11214227-Alexandrium_andersonii.AAC.1
MLTARTLCVDLPPHEPSLLHGRTTVRLWPFRRQPQHTRGLPRLSLSWAVAVPLSLIHISEPTRLALI